MRGYGGQYRYISDKKTSSDQAENKDLRYSNGIVIGESPEWVKDITIHVAGRVLFRSFATATGRL